MKPFVIEEKEDYVISSRMPETEEESWQLEIALRRLGAKKLDEVARRLIETGHCETISFRDMKKAVRQIKKNKVRNDGKMYAQLITKDGVKVYGPETPEGIFRQWEEDVNGKKD